MSKLVSDDVLNSFKDLTKSNSLNRIHVISSVVLAISGWRMRTHFSDRAFSAAGFRCWNSLPPVIRLADSVDSFKAQLKTHLFAKAYPS